MNEAEVHLATAKIGMLNADMNLHQGSVLFSSFGWNK